MKKILSVLLAVVIVCSFTVVLASADSTYTAFNYYYNVLSDEEMNTLNELGQGFVDNYGVAVILSWYGGQTVEDPEDQAQNDFYNDNCDCTDGIVLIDTDEDHYIGLFGKCEDMITDTEAVYQSFTDGETFYEHANSFMGYVAQYLANYSDETVTDEITTETVTYNTEFFTDNAELLTESEAEEVNDKLNEINKSTGYVTAILTVDDEDVNEYNIERYATDYFNDNFGSDGAVMVISMAERDWKYIFMGKADYTGAYSDDWITNQVSGYLSSGEYKDAFLKFADITEDVYTSTEDPDYTIDYSEYTDTKPIFNWGKGILISLIAGFVLSFIIMSILKSKLKSVHMQADANEYTRPGSMNVTGSWERFLYKNVTRVAKPKDTDHGSHGGGGGGGGSHSGGGKF